jgi:hypothetical protein
MRRLLRAAGALLRAGAGMEDDAGDLAARPLEAVDRQECARARSEAALGFVPVQTCVGDATLR